MKTKHITCLAIAFFISAALAQSSVLSQSFTGSASEKKGLAVAGISDRINPIVSQAEAHYRRGTPYASPVFVKGEVQEEINKVLGSRVSMFVTIDTVGSATATAKVDIRSKPTWTESEKRLLAGMDKELDSLTKSKPKAGDSTSSYNNQMSDLTKRIATYKQKTDALAKNRAPDAVVKIMFDAMPSNVRNGSKVTLMGWVKSVKVEGLYVDDIPYSKVEMTVQHEDTRVYGAAATQPDDKTPAAAKDDSLGSQLSAQASPATQPKPMVIGVAPSTQPAE